MSAKEPIRQSGDQHWTRREPDRILCGTRAPGAKLSTFEIEELCSAYDLGTMNKSELARFYGVARITIWRHLKARSVT